MSEDQWRDSVRLRKSTRKDRCAGAHGCPGQAEGYRMWRSALSATCWLSAWPWIPDLRSPGL